MIRVRMIRVCSFRLQAEDHSYRSATIGSTRAARRAGKPAATVAAAKRMAVATAIVEGSGSGMICRISDGRALADVAQACGYYDQPHMARDFGLLAQTSPTAWRRHAGELTPLFVAR